jgi:cytochrome b involved in lipid metabolism
MATDVELGPAARVLAQATSRNTAAGNENLGPLSDSHGFLSRRPPEHDLPSPHDAWVAAVDELPDLCRTLRVRPRLEELPALDASADSLDDRHLLRAASVLGLLAHAYNNVPMRPPEKLPDALVRPWLQTADRLERPSFTLTNTDYIFDNWRLVDPNALDPMRVENLRLLNAIWDDPQCETFILVLVELLARSAPLVGAAARAQNACLRRDDEALKAELVLMTDVVRRLTRDSLPKISANARAGRRRVDPVVWTKLFAMIPLPVQGAGEEVRNASGAETPYFHLLDVVLGRFAYETQLGHEALQFRRTHPPHWREFIAAVASTSIADYVRSRADRELSGLFAELGNAYYGRHGLLAHHRLKAFAYMEAAFKTGRTSTVTGFSGLFEDRAWETVDASFEAARLERVQSAPPPRLARVERVDELSPGIHRIVLDVRGLGLHCEPGDRCVVRSDESRRYAISSTADERIELTALGLPDGVSADSDVALDVVPLPGFALPRDASVPVVMLAEGIGIAPFVAFLDARPQATNVLLAEPDEAGRLPYPERIDRIGPRVDDLLREPETAARLRELMGRRGRIYVSGGAEFARRMMTAVEEALDGQDLPDLVVQHRYVQDVVPGAAMPRAYIDASELAFHNHPGESVWMAIDGRVYDLTAFAEMHPGGQKLIESFAGMEATSTYRRIEHDRDPSIQGLLSMFEIGALRRPELDDDTLDALFRRWAVTMNVLVEIENAHRLDTSIRLELPRTPFRLQFAIEAHARFLAQTIAIVCRRVAELARATGDGAALGDEVERVVDGAEALAARERCDELEGRLASDGATVELDALLSELQAADAVYLREAKTRVAAGVRRFERHAAEILATGNDALLDELLAFPQLTRAHFELQERLVLAHRAAREYE